MRVHGQNSRLTEQTIEGLLGCWKATKPFAQASDVIRFTAAIARTFRHRAVKVIAVAYGTFN